MGLVGSNPPEYVSFGHAGGGFFDGTMVNVLSDTVQVTFRYDPVTDPGGSILLGGTQGQIFGREYECSVMGRDLSEFDRFDQEMSYSGALVVLNSYNTAQYGRWTGELKQRFFLELTR